MNKDCSTWNSAITRLLDGELAAAERAALGSHLDGCERCRAELATRRDARTEWRETLSLSSNSADRATIVEMARVHLTGEPWWRRWLHTRTWDDLIAGVSLAAIVILAVTLGQWRAQAALTWAPSSPAEYYVDEQGDAGPPEIPRPF